MSGSDSNVEIKVTADISQLKAELSQAQDSVKNYATAVRNLTEVSEQLGGRSTSIEAQLKKDKIALDEARAKVTELVQQIKEVEAPATRAATGMKETADATKNAAAEMENFGRSASHAHAVNSGSIREAIVLLHELVTGNLNRIPGSLLVMGERVGGVTSAIEGMTATTGALGVAVIAVGAGIALWAYHAYQAETAIKAAALASVLGGRAGARTEIEKDAPGIKENSFGTVSTTQAVQLAAAIQQLNELTDEQKQKLNALAPAFLAMFSGNITETEKFIAETFKSEAAVKSWIDRIHLLGPAGIAAWDSTTDAGKRFDIAIQAATARIVPAFESWGKGAKALREELQLAAATAGMIYIPTAPGSPGAAQTPYAEGATSTRSGAAGVRGNIPESSAALIDNTARLLGLDQTLTNFATVIASKESGGSQTYLSGAKAGQLQTSPTRALGMMQVEPDDRTSGTTKTIGGQTYDLTDTAQNVKAALLMLSESYQKHNKDLREVATDYIGRGTSPAATRERSTYLSDLDQRGAFGGAAPSFKPFGDQTPGTTADLSADRDRTKIEEYRKANLEIEHLEEDRKTIEARQVKDTADAAKAAASDDTAAFSAARKRMEDDVDALREIAAKKALVRTSFDKDTEKTTARQIDTTKEGIVQSTPDRSQQAIKSAQAEEDAWRKAAQTAGITEGAKADFEDKATKAHIAGLRAQTQADGTYMSQKMAELRAGEANEAESALRSGATHEQMRARELQYEKNYWEQLKAGGNLTAEQQRQVDEKLNEVRKRIAEEAVTANTQAQAKQLAATEARLAHEVQLAGSNVAKIIALEQQRVAAVAAAEGTGTAAYYRALEQQTSAQKSAVDKQIREVEQGVQTRIAAYQQEQKAEEAANQITKAKMLQNEKNFDTQQYSAALQTLQSIIDLNGLDVAARDEALKQKKKLEDKFSQDVKKINAEMAKDAAATAEKEVQGYVQAFSAITSAGESSIVSLIEGQTTWLKAAANVANAMLTEFVSLTGKMLGRWLVYEAAKLTADEATQKAIDKVQETTDGSGLSKLVAYYFTSESAKTAAATSGATARAGITTAEATKDVAAQTPKTLAAVTAEGSKTAATTSGTSIRAGLTATEIAKDVGGQAPKAAAALTTEVTKTSSTAEGTAARTGIAAAADARDTASFLVRAARWLFGETSMTSATTAGTVIRTTAETTTAAASAAAIGVATRLQIAAAAAEAAAWAFADSASLGPVGLAAAPAVAAAAEANVMAYQALVPLAVGAYDVPMNMPAYLHTGEMVIPRTFATGLRAAVGSSLDAGTAGAATPGAGSSPPEVHINVSALDGTSVASFFNQHGNTIARQVASAWNNNPGIRPSYN